MRVLTVGGGSHGQALRADLKWEDLASHDPSNWSPGRGEEEDKDTDECNGSLLRGNILDNCDARSILAQSCGTEDRNEELGDGHADGTPEKQWTPTPFVNGIETWKGGRNVDGRGDHLNRKGVLDAGVLENFMLSVKCRLCLLPSTYSLFRSRR